MEAILFQKALPMQKWFRAGDYTLIVRKSILCPELYHPNNQLIAVGEIKTAGKACTFECLFPLKSTQTFLKTKYISFM